jgi:hypothetical protein
MAGGAVPGSAPSLRRVGLPAPRRELARGGEEGVLLQPAIVWRSGSIQTMTRSLLMFSAG